jgi:hypothetical protein
MGLRLSFDSNHRSRAATRLLLGTFAAIIAAKRRARFPGRFFRHAELKPHIGKLAFQPEDDTAAFLKLARQLFPLSPQFCF